MYDITPFATFKRPSDQKAEQVSSTAVLKHHILSLHHNATYRKIYILLLYCRVNHIALNIQGGRKLSQIHRKWEFHRENFHRLFDTNHTGEDSMPKFYGENFSFADHTKHWSAWGRDIDTDSWFCKLNDHVITCMDLYWHTCSNVMVCRPSVSPDPFYLEMWDLGMRLKKCVKVFSHKISCNTVVQ